MAKNMSLKSRHGEAGEAGCCGEGGCQHRERTTREGAPAPALPQRVELSLESLPGAGLEAVAEALRTTEGVRQALLNPITARAVLEFDPATARVEALVGLLEARGARAGDRLARWHVPLSGLACGRCAARIEEEVSRVSGVHGATVNRPAESLTVEYTPSRAELDAVRAILASRGFDPEAGAAQPSTDVS